MPFEALIRVASFVGILLILLLLESFYQRKDRMDSRMIRSVKNLGLVFVNNLVLRLLIPVVPATFAVFANSRGWGVFNYFQTPAILQWLATLLIFDFIIYIQHILFHAVPVLWRLHMIHHADLDIDATTGLRFHPLEIIISLFIKLGAVAAFGFPAGAVILFEIILNATSMFNHSNIYIPLAADRWIRRLIVTPDMHRVHHSVILTESNSNFGFNLSWWDRLCGTYQAQPAAGHKNMTIGLAQYRKPLSLWRILIMPFTDPPGPGPVNTDHN
ncbi:MAG TPA: sterol desaturase family protein [Desulfosalsimonadaceae bacterium]|nr:sterol desaturase family protein [Desulfosalsimonadaceae bacterium]